MNFDELHKKLFELQDLRYREFSIGLLPTVDPNSVIGIKTPALSKFAKQYFNDTNSKEFLSKLPHKYFEENSIHAILISKMKDYDACLDAVKKFLPHIDNWGNCDSLVPKIFAKHTDKLITEIKNWISSDEIYTIRFGISMLMRFYLDEHFDKEHLKLVAEIKNNDYYVEMMQAWYFTAALAKQYDAAIKFFEERVLTSSVHSKTIKKALESQRISAERKEYLKSLRIRHGQS